MKHIVAHRLIPLVLTAVLGYANADIIVVQETTFPNAQSQRVTSKYSSKKMRMDIGDPPQKSIILNSDGSTITLLHGEKLFMRTPEVGDASIATMAEELKRDPEKFKQMKKEFQPTPTGRTKDFQGWTLHEYIQKMEGKVAATMWIAEDYPEFGSILKELASSQKSGPMAQLAELFEFEFTELPGLPLISEFQSGDGKITVKILGIKKANINNDAFSIPDNYVESVQRSKPIIPTNP